MLKKLILENYRCFKKTVITYKELTIIVGKNNAGKSTLIESLRILAIVVNRSSNINYTNCPDWLNLSEDTLGIAPSLNNLDISTRNIFYMYGDPPAKISAYFENGVTIHIYIGEDSQIFATIFSASGINVESKKFAKTLGLVEINILPQISPLLKVESLIKFETVQRNISTNLSSRNFRNQLNYFPSEFDKFKNLSERTWEGLYIHSSKENIRTQGDLFLFVKDRNFEAEIGLMGHGLQMWLQTMWFLSRCKLNSIVILDEPDVYMHADLQRRLIKLIKSNFSQIMIATHSIEIMSEVEPENIMPINNNNNKQEYANNAPIVQKIVNDIGSVHNIEIARLFSYNKFLIFEGEKDDVKILTIFQTKVFPNTFEPFDVIPKTFVEGWGGWQRVIGSHKVFKDNKTSLTTYCIFDSDYHTVLDKTERLVEAKKFGINLHIWEKKEIENYLIIPEAIFRYISKNLKRNINISVQEIISEINSVCEELKDDLIDSFATEIKQKDNSKSIKTANQEARKLVNQNWELNKASLISGKTLLSELSKWSSSKYGVSFNRFAIAREIFFEEVFSEVFNVITAIENRRDFL